MPEKQSPRPKNSPANPSYATPTFLFLVRLATTPAAAVPAAAVATSAIACFSATPCSGAYAGAEVTTPNAAVVAVAAHTIIPETKNVTVYTNERFDSLHNMLG